MLANYIARQRPVRYSSHEEPIQHWIRLVLAQPHLLHTRTLLNPRSLDHQETKRTSYPAVTDPIFEEMFDRVTEHADPGDFENFMGLLGGSNLGYNGRLSEVANQHLSQFLRNLHDNRPGTPFAEAFGHGGQGDELGRQEMFSRSPRMRSLAHYLSGSVGLDKDRLPHALVGGAAQGHLPQAGRLHNWLFKALIPGNGFSGYTQMAYPLMHGLNAQHETRSKLHKFYEESQAPDWRPHEMTPEDYYAG